MVALGGFPGKLAVCGWSAGGNIAAGICQAARDAGGPAICGQVLVTPALDTSFTRASFTENGESYILTAELMHWFLDHYVGEEDRDDGQKGLPLALPGGRHDLASWLNRQIYEKRALASGSSEPRQGPAPRHGLQKRQGVVLRPRPVGRSGAHLRAWRYPAPILIYCYGSPRDHCFSRSARGS